MNCAGHRGDRSNETYATMPVVYQYDLFEIIGGQRALGYEHVRRVMGFSFEAPFDFRLT
jgi:hypothetical protein